MRVVFVFSLYAFVLWCNVVFYFLLFHIWGVYISMYLLHFVLFSYITCHCYVVYLCVCIRMYGKCVFIYSMLFYCYYYYDFVCITLVCICGGLCCCIWCM